MKPSKKEIKAPARTKGPVVATAAVPQTFHPLQDFISVKDPGEKEKMANVGGILVPEMSVQLGGYNLAEAIEVGPQCTHVKKGDRIVCNREHINSVKVAGNIYWTIREMQCMGTLTRDLQPKTD